MTQPDAQQLWLELPPISGGDPTRLLVFLHGAGSSPEAFAPVAIAWQLKFPGAASAILQGLEPGASGEGHDWFDGRGVADERLARVRQAADTVNERIAALQRSTGIPPSKTILVGFSQGGTVALELARRHPDAVAIVVTYAGQLASPVRTGERVTATIHLIHGELDTLVPKEHAHRALKGLQAIGADVTVDITEDGTHWVGQDMIIIGTTRAMQTIFKGRRRASRPAPGPTLH